MSTFPSMPMFVCTNCGFWQRHFAPPRGCPVCEDVRHTPPEAGYEFLTPSDVTVQFRTSWEQITPGLWMCSTVPKLGIGPVGWLVEHPAGNLAWECAGWLDDAALDFIAERGGVRWAAASHPHAYGALWRLQERFAPEVLVQVNDLAWTTAFAVTWPYDDAVELAPGLSIHHTGGHFAGHAVAFASQQRLVLAGDAFKLHWNEGELVGLSCHKAFNRNIPLTYAELRRYREVLAALPFAQVCTSFDHAVVDRQAVLRMLDVQLTERPTVEAAPLKGASA